MGVDVDLGEFADKLDELDGEHEIPLEEMFPNQWMETYTDFSTFDELLEESEWQVESREDFLAIPDEPWDEYVEERTQFEGWQEMQQAAASAWIKRQF